MEYTRAGEDMGGPFFSCPKAAPVPRFIDRRIPCTDVDKDLCCFKFGLAWIAALKHPINCMGKKEHVVGTKRG